MKNTLKVLNDLGITIAIAIRTLLTVVASPINIVNGLLDDSINHMMEFRHEQ